jgi:hypothetical protein
MNADFRKLNSDISSVPAAFAGLASDCEINFCLAQRTPAGTATTGIVRKSTTVTAFTTNDFMKFNANGGDAIWDASKYLNIWVCNMSGGILGYAQFPGGPVATDGVVINYTAFGTTGTAAAPFNKGRTATHEVGHWLNLFHIWGDDGNACTGSDLVNDTPNQADENYGCPSFPSVSCSNGANGDMFMNYMDYTDDACMFMFSAGQKARIDALFITGGSKASLLTSLGCQAPNGTSSCGTPTSLTASAITTTGATLGCSAIVGATSYNVQYKLSTSITWTTTTSTTNSKVLTGLVAGSSYDYQIQAICSTTGTYSTSTSFTTTAITNTCTSTYESNNTTTTASVIAPNTTISSQIQTTTDIDWYKVTTTASAPKIKVTLSNLPADYDMKLYKSNGTSLLGTSQNGGTANETITYNIPTTASTYYIRIYGYNGAVSTTNCYTLVTQTSASNLKEVASEISTKSALNIFPNPSSTKTGVTFFAEENKEASVVIYNTMGQKIATVKQTTMLGENTMYVNVATFANGLYLMDLVIDGEHTIQKFSVIK